MELTTEFPFVVAFSVAVIAVLLIGIAKAGFGGGVGLLTTPLMSLVMPAKITVGFLLPLLIIADGFTLIHHRGHWDKANLKMLIPAACLGIILGVLLIDIVSDQQLKHIIGGAVIIFTAVQIVRNHLQKGAIYTPVWWQGGIAGTFAGFVSAIAHSAGAIIAIYLLPQRLDKRVFVSTMVLFFAIINLLKVPPYLAIGLIDWQTLKSGLIFVPFIPIGTLLGAWLNRRLNQNTFMRIIYILVLITGLQLLFGFNVLEWIFTHNSANGG
jgi:uncharacterized protein